MSDNTKNFMMAAADAKATQYQTIADRCWAAAQAAYDKNDLKNGDSRYGSYLAACSLRDYFLRRYAEAAAA
jgi:hypothetical protein